MSNDGFVSGRHGAVAAAGYISEDAPGKLALSVLAGHFLAMVLIKPAGTDFGLLPLSLLLLGNALDELL